MENDSSDRIQNDAFQDEGSLADNDEVLEVDEEEGTNDEICNNALGEEEGNYVDAWKLSLAHATAAYQSSTSFTSSVMDSERSDLRREGNVSERLHQQVQRQSLLSDQEMKNQLLHSSDGERIANSIIAKKEEMTGMNLRQPSAGTILQPPIPRHKESLDLEQPSVISSASTKPPPPPDLNRRSNFRPSHPGAVAMVGHQLQVNIPAEGLDDWTVQVGTGTDQHQEARKEATSPVVDAVLVSDEVAATTSPQHSVAATTAVPMDESDLPRWGLRDRRVICVICVLVSIIAGLAAVLSFVFFQSQKNEPILTSSPTIAPTIELVPTGAPTSRMTFLQGLLSKYVSDVASWENVNSTQYKTLDWLANDDTWRPTDMNIVDTERALVERYAMRMIYFSLDGPSWSETESLVHPSRHVCSWQAEYCDSIIGGCEIHGVLCNENQLVTGLVLAGEVDVVGTIPTEVVLLSSLSTLFIANSTLYGTLPEELFLLPGLESVSVVDSRLSGTLPSSILQAPSLSWLNLRGNIMDGTIENAANPGLLALDLGDNQFSGPLPAFLSNRLYYLDVSNNAGLTGTIPSVYSRLSLTNLFVEGTNLSDLESVFCGTGLLDYEEFYADCGGSRPKVLCNCCTHCCDEIDCSPNYW